MRDSDKLPTIAVVWVAVAAILIFAADSATIIPLAIFLGLAAMFSTLAVVGVFQNDKDQSEQAAAKAKRSGRISRLVDDLDDEEVYQLEELLQSRRDDRIRDDSF